MDFDKHQQEVGRLEGLLEAVKKGDPKALREFAVGLRGVLMTFLKDRKEPVRPGQIFKDAAAKGLVPGEIAPRGDALLIRWTGQVVPQDPAAVQEDASRWSGVAEKVLPVLKAYRKQDSAKG